MYNIEIARSDRTVIYETPEGYGLRRGGNPMEMLSNFVVRILGNVAFGDGSALHHSAAVLVGGGQHETVLPTRLLDQPRELVEHIHQLLTLRRNTTVPMLRDPGAFRSVVFYLRGLLPRLPSRPGAARKTRAGAAAAAAAGRRLRASRGSSARRGPARRRRSARTRRPSPGRA